MNRVGNHRFFSITWLPSIILIASFGMAVPVSAQFEENQNDESKQETEFEGDISQQSTANSADQDWDKLDSEKQTADAIPDSPRQGKPAAGSGSSESIDSPGSQQNPVAQTSASEPAKSENSETQSDESGPPANQAASPAEPEEPFEQRFWKYLQGSRYQNWAPVPGKTGDFDAGTSPHGQQLKMYLNRTAAGRPSELPAGSIIVKENYDDQQQLLAVTVMYKSDGYHPAGKDWFWVKYNSDGSVAMSDDGENGTRLAGRVQSCIDCHHDAEQGDFVFFND